MSLRISGKLMGLQEVMKAMAGLKGTVQNRVCRAGMRKLASQVSKTAKANVTGKTGGVKQSIGIVKIKTYPSGVTTGIVGARGGFPHGPLAHLVEFGTVARYTKRGAFRGVMPARPFLAPAFDANVGQAEAIFGAELDKELAKL